MKLFLTDLIELLEKLREFIFQELDPNSKTLSTNQLLFSMPFFRTLDPKKDYYKLDSSILDEKFKSLENNIGFLLRGLRNDRNLPKILEYPNEKSFFSFFLSRLPSKNQLNSILLKEIWRFSRANPFPPRPLASMNLFLVFELIKLDFYGFSIPSDQIDDYPLHALMFSGDASLFESLSEHNCLEGLDPIGNTPFKLALMLQRTDLAQILVGKNVDCKLRAYNQASTGFEETVRLKDKSLLKEIFRSAQRKKLERWEKTRFLISNQLSHVPDFECQMNWECDSKYLPFLGLIAPKDTCQIQKKGSNLNISLNVIGWKKGSLKTGDFLGVFSNADVYLVDRACGKVIRMNENWQDEGFLQGLVDKTLNSSRLEERETDLKAEKMRFEVLKNIKGKPIIEKIENYDAFKYEIKGELTIKKRAFDGKKMSNAGTNASFEEYFTTAMKNAVFYYTAQGYFNKSFSVIGHLIETYHKFENLTKNNKNNNNNNSFFEQKSKNINATLWMIQDFELNFQHIIPILEVLEIFSTNIRKFKDFLKTFGYKTYFPIKVSIPLIFSIYASITFSNFHFLPPASTRSLDIFDRVEENLNDLDKSLNESDQSLERAHQKFNSLVKTRNKTSINSDYFNIFEDNGLIYNNFHKETAKTEENADNRSKNELKTLNFLKNNNNKNDLQLNLNQINEENIPEDEQKTNVQTPRILNNTPKTMKSKNLMREIEEINPQLKGIIKNALVLNQTISYSKGQKSHHFHNKETLIMNENGEEISPLRTGSNSLDRDFKELDLILFERLRSKSIKSVGVHLKKSDVDVKLKRK